jgi:hypothetical protein
MKNSTISVALTTAIARATGTFQPSRSTWAATTVSTNKAASQMLTLKYTDLGTT